MCEIQFSFVSNTTFKLYSLTKEILSVSNINLLLYLSQKRKVEFLSMSDLKFKNVHEDKKVFNENCVIKLPNDRFYSVTMNLLLVQSFNTRKKMDKTNNCKTLQVSKLE